MRFDLTHHLRLGAGVGVQFVHLRQPQMIETQHFDRRRIIDLHPLSDLVHHIGHAHQAALELPAVHRRRQPRLCPERAPYQRHGNQHAGKYTAHIEAKVIAARFTEQHYCQSRQHHGQHQEQHGHDQRAAAGLLAESDGVAGFEFEHPVQVSRRGGVASSHARANKLNDASSRFL